MPQSRFPLAWIETKSQQIYRAMEEHGLPVDQPALWLLIHTLQQEFRSGLVAIENETGLRIDPARASDVEQVAEHFGIVLPRTKRNRARIDYDTLAEFAALRPVAELKSLQNQLGTARGVFDRVFDSRLWPKYVFTEELGRPHSGCINYMAWPERFRPIITARDGFCFFTADHQAMELRVLAALSQDEALLAALDDSDFHRATAARMFDKSLDEVTDAERQVAKTLTFAILYGSTTSGVAFRLKVAPQQAEAFIHRWQSNYPKAMAFVRRVQRDGIKNQLVESFHGRRRNLSDLIKQDTAKARRLAINHVIQSTAGDLLRIGLIHVWPEILKLEGRILGTVHDSFMGIIPKTVPIDQLAAITRANAVEIPSEGYFQLRMKLSLGPRWGEISEEHVA